jgi:hypothetical protein
MSEPKTVAPITMFGNRPAIGSMMIDFRPLPVAANDAMPVRGDIAELMEEVPDPKADSSATEGATSSENDSDETMTPEQTITLSPVAANFVSVGTGTPPSTPMTPPGNSVPPVAPTGQTVPPAPLRIGTPSSPGADKL